jgi:hypothetical protein
MTQEGEEPVVEVVPPTEEAPKPKKKPRVRTRAKVRATAAVEVLDLPMTKDEFTASLDQLVERARSAGIRPLQIMAATYVKQGMSMIDGLLGAFETRTEAKVKAVEKDKE